MIGAETTPLAARISEKTVQSLLRAIGLWLLIGMVGGTAAWADSPVTLTFTLTHGVRQNPFTVPTAALAWKFKESVERSSKGQVRVNITPGGQAGAEDNYPQLVARNVVQSAILPASAFVAAYPPMAAALAPFTLRNRQHAIHIYGTDFGQALAEDVSAKTGLMVLGWPMADGRHIITNQRHALTSPDDVQGVRMVVMNQPGWMAAALSQMGGTALPAPAQQVFPWLDANKADGFAGPSSAVLSMRLDDVQAFATVTDHVQAPLVWLFNMQSFAALTEDQRRAVRLAAQDALTSAHRLALQLDAEDLESYMLPRLMDVTVLDADQHTAFRDAVADSVLTAVETTHGKDAAQWLLRLRQAAAAH